MAPPGKPDHHVPPFQDRCVRFELPDGQVIHRSAQHRRFCYGCEQMLGEVQGFLACQIWHLDEPLKLEGGPGKGRELRWPECLETEEEAVRRKTTTRP